jgi:hypothetical protein
MLRSPDHDTSEPQFITVVKSVSHRLAATDGVGLAFFFLFHLSSFKSLYPNPKIYKKRIV